MSKKDDGWITVGKHKKKNISISTQNPVRPISIEPKVVFLNEEYDPLSLLVYYVLFNNDFPEPSSFIRKEVNRLLQSKSTPQYIQNKKHLFKKEYTKKDIGFVLYDGPLSKIVIKNDFKIPRLWSLPK